MLVMSLSPLLGQAIPDIAETAEILVFPRRGARSGSSRVPKPQGKNQPRDPPRNSWRVLGGARGGLGARFWHIFGFVFLSMSCFLIVDHKKVFIIVLRLFLKLSGTCML